MYIGSRHNLKIMNDDLPVVINNQLVPRERSFTCLGVKLDETLEWNEHIKVICKKVAAGIGMMKRIKPFVPANTLQTIYQALIQPYFDCCSPLWGVNLASQGLLLPHGATAKTLVPSGHVTS